MLFRNMLINKKCYRDHVRNMFQKHVKEHFIKKHINTYNNTE